MSVQDKKRLRDKINTLSSTEHSEILKIINSSFNPNDQSYTKNTNGIFFDLKNLDSNIIEDIEKFVNFCIENQEVLDEYDKKYNECKTQNTFEKVYQQQSVQHNLVNIDDDNYNLEKAIREMKVTKKTEQFANIIQSHTEKLFKKNTSTKFTNAKKKYAKRVLQDKKIESEQQSNLFKENYLI